MSSSEWTLSDIVGCVLLIETIHYSPKHNADLQKLMMQLVVGTTSSSDFHCVLSES